MQAVIAVATPGCCNHRWHSRLFTGAMGTRPSNLGSKDHAGPASPSNCTTMNSGKDGALSLGPHTISTTSPRMPLVNSLSNHRLRASMTYVRCAREAYHGKPWVASLVTVLADLKEFLASTLSTVVLSVSSLSPLAVRENNYLSIE